MRVLVTKKENVERLEEGDYRLIDDKIIGYLTKTHPLTAQAVDPETNQLKFGTIMRSEVFWIDERSPSPSLEDPEDLVWLQFIDSDPFDSEDDDDDEVEEIDSPYIEEIHDEDDEIE